MQGAPEVYISLGWRRMQDRKCARAQVYIARGFAWDVGVRARPWCGRLCARTLRPVTRLHSTSRRGE